MAGKRRARVTTGEKWMGVRYRRQTRPADGKVVRFAFVRNGVSDWQFDSHPGRRLLPCDHDSTCCRPFSDGSWGAGLMNTGDRWPVRMCRFLGYADVAVTDEMGNFVFACACGGWAGCRSACAERSVGWQCVCFCRENARGACNKAVLKVLRRAHDGCPCKIKTRSPRSPSSSSRARSDSA